LLALEVAIDPLRRYIDVYSQFHEILLIDPVKFAETECTPEKSPEEIAVVIREYKKKGFFF
jgi:hypothetical protein